MGYTKSALALSEACDCHIHFLRLPWDPRMVLAAVHTKPSDSLPPKTINAKSEAKVRTIPAFPLPPMVPHVIY